MASLPSNWTSLHKKLLANWLNAFNLTKTSYDQETVVTCFQDGTTLLHLIEKIFSNACFPQDLASQNQEAIESSISNALNFLNQEHSLDTTFFSPTELLKGNEDFALPLLWILMMQGEVKEALKKMADTQGKL